MAKRISDTTWQKYVSIINQFVENDAGLQDFIWLRKSKLPPVWNEESNTQYYKETLQGLFQYNHIRAWPTGVDTPSGSLDTTSTVLYITKNQLQSRGFLDSMGEWTLDIISDRFILEGRAYKPSGTSQMAQAQGQAIMYFIVIEALDPAESDLLIEQYK